MIARFVRVMTWNIHGALGRNRRFDLKRVVELIRRSDPDIVALQEVDSRRPRTDDPFVFLQGALGAHGLCAKSIIAADGEYGQMLISRWPMRGTEVFDISYGEREPRRVIRSEIETPGGSLRVVATHLGLSLRERHEQTRALMEIVGRGSGVTILLGDFNDWIWPGSVRRALAQAMPGHTRHRTFPSFFPLLQLDRVYCRPARALIGSFVDRSGRRLSDHLPVIADLELQAVEEVEYAPG